MIVKDTKGSPKSLTGFAPEPLPAKLEATYSVIIDEILRASDINTISAKRIRKGLHERIGHDLSEQKVRIATEPVWWSRTKTNLGTNHHADYATL